MNVEKIFLVAVPEPENATGNLKVTIEGGQVHICTFKKEPYDDGLYSYGLWLTIEQFGEVLVDLQRFVAANSVTH
jgi:hypothetical protein